MRAAGTLVCYAVPSISTLKETIMSEKDSCSTPQEHKVHMCQLKQEGKIEEIDRHSAKPKFVCNKCGAKADDEGYLCNPRPL
jgi:hypothetical protein